MHKKSAYLVGIVVCLVCAFLVPYSYGEELKNKQISVLAGGFDKEFAKDIEAQGFQLGSGKLPLDKFNVVIVGPTVLMPDTKEVYRYVEEGGGLFIADSIEIGMRGTEFFNSFLSPLGAEFLLESICDRERSYQHKRYYWQMYKYSWTTNIVNSLVTKDVKTYWYPNGLDRYLNNVWVATHAMVLDDNWQVVVQGMESTASYPLDDQGFMTELPGRYKTSPPLFAIRKYGKGRIAIMSTLAWFHLTQGNTLMADGVMLKNGNGERKSDVQKLIVNTLKWLAEPSLLAGKPGGYKPITEVAKPKLKPEPVTWNKWKKPGYEYGNLDMASKDYVGLIGAHTNLSTGEGTVEEMVLAAKEAGYWFIIFTENLEHMNKDKYEKLLSECKRLSANKDFLAIPGLKYKQKGGLMYLIWGIESFPQDKYLTPDKKKMRKCEIYFDNRMPGLAAYNVTKQPLHPWFHMFYNSFAVYTYERGKLIDDAIEDYCYLEENHANLIPISVHLVYSPEEIKQARMTGLQTYVKTTPTGEWKSHLYPTSDWQLLVKWFLSYGGGSGFFRRPQQVYVSSGPRLAGAGLLFKNDLPWDISIKSDRVRLGVNLISKIPLEEVVIRDGSRIYRRFYPKSKRFTLSMEDYHSKQWDWIVDATDEQGGRLISSSVWTRVWRNWSQMCADQQNILGYAGLFFKGWTGFTQVPPKPEVDINLGGWGDDSSISYNYNVYPWPDIIEESSTLPSNIYNSHPYAEHHMGLCSGELLRIDSNYRWLAHWGATADNQLMPLPIHPRRQAKTELYTFFQSRPTPSGVWSVYSCKKAGVSLLEVYMKTTKDLMPSSSVKLNLPLVWIKVIEKKTGFDHLAYNDQEGKQVTLLRSQDTRWKVEGEVGENSFVALYPHFFGSLAVYNLNNSKLVFNLFEYANGEKNLLLGVQLPNEMVEKGTEFTYRFLLIRGAATRSAEEDLVYFNKFRKDFGIGTKPGYEVKVTLGKVLSTKYILNLESDRYGFAGKIKKTELAHEVLPAMVKGLNNNWDAACYDRNSGWLKRIPVKDNIGYFTLAPEKGDCDFYVGNLLLCDKEEVSLRLLHSIKDYAIFTAHNSSSNTVDCTVEPALGFSKYYPIPGFKKKIQIPAGSTLTVEIGEKGN